MCVPTVCILESEGTFGDYPHFPLHLTESLFATACARPASFGGFFCLHLPSCHRYTGITDTYYHAQPYVSSGDLNLGPHTCIISTLSIEPIKFLQ